MKKWRPEPWGQKGSAGIELGSLTGCEPNVSSISPGCQWLEPLAHLAGDGCGQSVEAKESFLSK